VAAVAGGGWTRTAGPLVTGTAILVVLTIHESLATLAGVPTWAWLATGGTVLLATGIALERTDTSPIEATRRIVDVLNENFS
jgi:Tfp pilus assembly protein PilZ